MFFLISPQARDLLRDTYQSLGNFKKPGPEGNDKNPTKYTFRIMASCWQIQTLYRKDGKVKGAHLRIREDGVGAEFSQMPPNLALGKNILNQLSRTGGLKTQKIARTLTLGHLLIVGQKSLTLQKTQLSQQAACRRKHGQRG